MKRSIFVLVLIVALMSSCAIHSGLTDNENSYTTQVVLSQANFKVLTRVKGEAKALYVFGVGGLLKEALIEQARSDMLSRADIIGGPKAIINQTVEIKRSSFLFVSIYKVIVSGHIIEFTE